MIAECPSPPGQEVNLADWLNFFDAQKRATRAADTHRYTLYGGCRGPGKSHWLRKYPVRRLLHWAAQGHTNVAVGLFCEDYPTLQDRQISKIAVEFPAWLGELKTTKTHGLGFILRPQWGGGALLLRNLDDPSKYVSSEFAGIAVEELTKHQVDTFNILIGSLRWPGIDDPFFIGATNPGGIGHTWCRQHWGIQQSQQLPPEREHQAEEFVYVPALPEDNPYLGRDYWDMLDSLPESLRPAWRYGDWTSVAGMFFSEHWRPYARDGKLAHIIPAFDVPDDWPLFGSVDYGFHARFEGEKPFVYGLYALDYDGHAYLIDELAAAHWDIERQTDAIQQLESRYEGNVRYRVGCKSMFTKRSESGPTIAEDYQRASLPVVPPNSDRINGWARCRAWLGDAPDGKPYFMCFDRCKHFINQIPGLPCDPNQPDDIDHDADDHAAEEFRHFLMSRPAPPHMPSERVPEASGEAVLARARRRRGRR